MTEGTNTQGASDSMRLPTQQTRGCRNNYEGHGCLSAELCVCPLQTVTDTAAHGNQRLQPKPVFGASFARLQLYPEARRPCHADRRLLLALSISPPSAPPSPQLRPSPSSARSRRGPRAGRGAASSSRRLVAAALPSVGTDRNGGGQHSLLLRLLLVCRAAAPGLGAPEALASPRSQH